MNEEFLANAKVKDISGLIDANPALVTSDTSIRDTLEKIIVDTRSRHAYIVDENKVLIGSIRMNNVVQYLFPTFSLMQDKETFKIGSFLEYTTAQKAGEIMNPRPVFVYEDSLISEMVSIMMRERTNEMPVVDKQKHVIGEVNVLNIIAYYLKHTD
ncbi:MAG: CBS domain-containing protein [Candidatus Cloacimonadales bacterium]|nr:CBS domain-containing protein [Candidatus Cloacimonadales bacterium]